MARNHQSDERPVTSALESPAPGQTNSRLRGQVIQNATLVFWLMFGINAVNYLDRLIVVAVGPILKREFRLEDSQIGLLGGAFIIVYALSALPCGILADRLSRTRVITFGVALWSAMSTATAFVFNFPTLFVTRALVGVGEASYYPAGSALLGAYFSLKDRARVMSRWQVGQLVGMILAFAVVFVLDLLIPPTQAWRVAFFVTGVPGLILAAIVWLVRDQPAVPVEDDEPASEHAPTVEEVIDAHGSALRVSGGLQGILNLVGKVLRIPTVWLIIVLQAMYFIVVTPATTFLPIYVSDAFKLSPGTTSLIAGIIIIAGGVSGMLLGGYVADRLSDRFPGGRVLAVTVGFGLALPCWAIFLTTQSLPVLVIFGILAVLGINIPLGPLTAALQDATPPALRATAFAVALTLSHLLGDAWAPGAVGSLSTNLGEQANLALLIVGTPSLAIAALAGYFGARFYASDVRRRLGNGATSQ